MKKAKTQPIGWLRVVFLFTLLCTFGSAVALPFIQAELSPPAPTAVDQISAKVTSTYPTSGYQVSSANLTITGNDIQIDVIAFAPTGPVLQVITSDTQTVNIGQLPAGDYKYTVDLYIAEGDIGIPRPTIITLVDSVSGTLTVTPDGGITGPLPDGSLLGIASGSLDSNGACASGSCFGLELSPGVIFWTPVKPGTDGGIIIGKNQGFIDYTLSPLPLSLCEITAPWEFFGQYGCFATEPNAHLNIFDAHSCTGPDCIGKTELNSWDVIWNGNRIPLGSTNGCQSFNCTPDQLAGIFVRNWQISLDLSTGQGNYILDYSNTVPSHDPSGHGGVQFYLHLEGPVDRATQVNHPPVAGPTTVDSVPQFPSQWIPKVKDPDGDALTCSTVDQPANGTATVAADCSGGTYTSNDGSNDRFTYAVFDGELRSEPAVVDAITCVNIQPAGIFVGDVTVSGEANTTIAWKPSVSSIPGCGVIVTEPTCSIDIQPANGIARVAPDCSTGTYTPTQNFTGTDTFTYGASNNVAKDTGTVSVDVLSTCASDTLLQRVTLFGGGQSPAVNETLAVIFTGHIVSTTKSSVRICPGTRLQFETGTSAGTPHCMVNGRASYPSGTLVARDKLICNNKPTGRDTDKFRILD